MNDRVCVIIPARNEEFLAGTIERTLQAAQGDLEIVAVCDGYWPQPGIPDHPQVTLIHHTEPVGQRAAVNEAARLTRAKYILKTDAHSMFDEGFDVKLKADCRFDWTVIPRMYNLHIFDWICGHGCRIYQDKIAPGTTEGVCPQCNRATTFTRDFVWQPRRHKMTDYMHIDHNLKVKYWYSYVKRQEAKGEITDVMNGIGACWFQYRDRFWELGGLDEAHGGWGQVGTEIACKAWLSGGRHVVNKKTWFAHLFRTTKQFSFPYRLKVEQQRSAEEYSRQLWFNDRWPAQRRRLSWLIGKFSPVPSWDGQLQKEDAALTVIYYSANVIPEQLACNVREHLTAAVGTLPVISVTHKPIELGQNICVGDIGRSLQNIYRQVLTGAKAARTKYVALVEDDCLYGVEHFQKRPQNTPFAYNLARWCLHSEREIYTYRHGPVLSQCIADREKLIECLKRRFELTEIPDKHCGEPGLFERKLGLPEYEYECFRTKRPNIVICHKKNITGTKYIGKDGEPTDRLPLWGRAGDLLKKVKGEPMAKYGRGARAPRTQKRQHSYIGSIIFGMDEIMANLMHYADRRKPGRAEGRMQTLPPFIKEVAEGNLTDCVDEQLKAFPWFGYLCQLYPTWSEARRTQRVLQIMRETIGMYDDIAQYGLKSPLDMWREGPNRLVLHRGWRRLLIMNELHRRGLKDFATVPVRVFKSKQIFRKYNPSVQWLPGSLEPDSIHNLAIQQFMKLKERATDKYWVHGYTKLYDKELGYLRARPLKILEIGVYRGASLLLWRDAFPKAQVFGIDKNTAQWQRFLKGKKRIKVFVGHQEDTDFLQEQVIPAGPFDIIIDDGAHLPDETRTAMKTLMPHLVEGGYYVIEDLYGNYRPERRPHSMMEDLKAMMDEVQQDSTLRNISMYYNICFMQKA